MAAQLALHSDEGTDVLRRPPLCKLLSDRNTSLVDVWSATLSPGESSGSLGSRDSSTWWCRYCVHFGSGLGVNNNVEGY
jgi:hypothetical protein